METENTKKINEKITEPGPGPVFVLIGVFIKVETERTQESCFNWNQKDKEDETKVFAIIRLFG
jgi:hypothetical protein